MPPSPLFPPTPLSTPFVVTPPRRATIGPITGTIIILFLLIVAALYFYGATLNRNRDISDQYSDIPDSGTITGGKQ